MSSAISEDKTMPCVIERELSAGHQSNEVILMQYIEFIKGKQLADVPTGFDADVPIGPLFDFQAACVKWALKRGRAALFLDTGLGKTLCQVTWAHKVCEHTGGNVIIDKQQDLFALDAA